MIIPEEVAKKINEAYRELVDAHQKDHEIWFEHVFLSWQWWCVVMLTIIPWALWWKFRKKGSTGRLLYGGLFIIAISMFLDSYGAELGLWDYKYEVFPYLPSFLPWDLSLLPVLFLFLMQIKPKISPLIKALFYSIFSTFIGEPIFKWLGYYEPINWSAIYSFPIHFILFLIGYYLVTRDNFEVLRSK